MFTPRQLALMGMLIALNVVLGSVVQIVKLPVFLDAIGTILAALLLGWLPAVVVGVASFLVAAVTTNPTYAWFIGTQAAIALAAYGAASRLRAFSSWPRVVVFGLLLGVLTGIVSAPVIVFVFGGVSGSGRDLITAGLVGAGQQIAKAVLWSGAASEPLDKLLQSAAAYAVLAACPKRLLRSYRNPVLEANGLL